MDYLLQGFFSTPPFFRRTGLLQDDGEPVFKKSAILLLTVNIKPVLKL